MSKDQKTTTKLKVENVDKLIMSCKMINEVRSGLKDWKFDLIWPINFYEKKLNEIVELLNSVVLSSDFSK